MAVTTPSTYHSTVQTSRIGKEVLTSDIETGNFLPLEEIDCDKYLGVYLDKDLNFNTHVNEATKKATKLLDLCRRNLHMCTRDIKESAYKSIVRPHLDYASAAWSPHTSKNINKIEAVQRRAARFVLSDYDYSPTSNLSHKIRTQLKWLPLQHRRFKSDVLLFFKIKHHLVNTTFPSTVTPSTLHPHRFSHIQSLHSEVYKNSFFVRSVRFWNILPQSTQSLTQPLPFKTAVTSFVTPLEWVKVHSAWTLA